MTIRQLLEDKEFWEAQKVEFLSTMADFVGRKKVPFDTQEFYARLYLQHMLCAIDRMDKDNPQ